MRKLFLMLFASLMAVTAAVAQDIDMMGRIPADPDVKIGRLENGMTYYLRHNAKPEKQAEFYIYHDVGAVQEEDSQTGLAHFLEHMAFNGTVNLPDKQLINYLEAIGVKFGANLNAMTGQEMTVYLMSSVPLAREGVIDTALLILHDWSHFIALEGDEIDNERGVIIEELRQGNTANRRVMEKNFPVMFNGSKYAYRNVIGTEDQLRNFSHQEIRDFYHRWYRPDLQTIVVVGDIDVDEIEAKLVKLMADIPAVENPEQKVDFAIPDNDSPLVGIATDPELNSSSVTLFIKRETIPYEMNDMTMIHYVNTLLNIGDKIANYRLQEIVNEPNAPFVTAWLGNTEFTRTTDALYGSISARDGETATAFEAFYAEIEKIRRYGFTESELERAKEDMLRAAEKKYDNRNDRRNSEFVWPYLNHFVHNRPIPSAEMEWLLDSTFIASANIMELNMIMQQLITPENQVVIITSPEKEGVYVPTEQEVLAIIEKVSGMELTPYEDNVVKEPLIGGELTGSPVVSTETDHFGATILTLGNGAKVIVKQTDFKADEVVMSINSKGGLSILSDSDYANGEFLGDLVSMSGVGKFTATDLSKQLSGKVARITPSIQEYENGFGGSASVKDFETLLQLTYLYFTQPRFTRDDFDRLTDRYSTMLANSASNPQFILMDSVTNTLYGHNPRKEFISLEKLRKLDFDRMEPIYRQLYGNADDFNFIFVGNLDMDEVRPLIEKYIGSLPSMPEKFTAVDDGVRYMSGEVTNRFTTPMQTPKTSVMYLYNGMLEYTPETLLHVDVLAQILRTRYTESIREEKGGTYGVMVMGSSNDEPVEQYLMQIYFDTDPDMADELMELVVEEIEKIAQEGPLAEDLGKVREFLVKQRADDLKKNNVWLNYIDNYYVNSIDIHSGYDRLIAELSGQQIQAIARKILEDGNLIRVIMDPQR